jgi:hypothetical protein
MKNKITIDVLEPINGAAWLLSSLFLIIAFAILKIAKSGFGFFPVFIISGGIPLFLIIIFLIMRKGEKRR